MNEPIISLRALQDYANRLAAEIELKKKQREALLMVIDLYGGGGDLEAISPAPSTVQVEAPPPAPVLPKPLANYTTDLSDLSVDFTGTTNMLERLRRIGQKAEGRLLNLTEVSRFLLRSGESTATLRNLRNNVYSGLKDHPEHFEKVSSGNYLYHDTPRTPGLDDRFNDCPAPQSLLTRDLM